jgi:hypothetical protein
MLGIGDFFTGHSLSLKNLELHCEDPTKEAGSELFDNLSNKVFL